MSGMFFRAPLVSPGADGSAMSSPSVRVNTFVQENDDMYIDPISKAFIISEAVFGYFRIPWIRNRKFFYLLAVFYTLFLNGVIFFLSFLSDDKRAMNAMAIAHVFQYAFCSLLSLVCIKRLQCLYSTLNSFDQEVKCRPKASQQCIQNLVQNIVTIILYGFLFIIPKQLGLTDKLSKQYVIMHMAYTIEINYYGHLLNILVPRLKLINYYIESSLANVNSKPTSFMKQFVYFKRNAFNTAHYRMKKLMDLYQIIVEAYDFLIDAIKWQLLVSIITAFVLILGFLFMFSLHVIKSEQNIVEGLVVDLSLSVLIMSPLFALCTYGDKVHHEVKRMRELLASRLYENKLDKSGRSIARALLAFTETRDLSFRLLRMLNIDISLPFKFIGLLITYLIILLQFEKVINPGTTIDVPL